MRNVLIIMMLLSSAFAQAACKLSEEDIVGAWVIANNQSSFFEEFELAKDGSFNSWLHHRPDVTNGRWALKNCHLNIVETNSSTDFKYEVKIKAHQLYLIEMVENKKEISRFKRIK